ncbi:hypothetical protein NSK_005698 [Nannochloropsis salina CCMP1776]|uniref:Folate-biopterin transporter n=1 Tax=Nannochloropsis salina CCMP1776 TaxID=1027361 RepID=A0A4D9CUW2_9STRA|nr:hypothetical protein NSK_005698 [Nannochloropsis salina CCMP1776]|eukprot:TFJ83010.1 hypothetical protein NSK_005698 [Nannochloropsis salina CCMP1776]
MTPASPKPVGPTDTSAAHAHTLAGEDSDHHTKAIEMGDLPFENSAYDAWAHEEDGEERTAIPLAVASPFPGKHSRATLINPWSRINWGITVGTFVYNLTSTFLVIPMGFYVVQDLMMDGRALNVVQSMLVGWGLRWTSVDARVLMKMECALYLSLGPHTTLLPALGMQRPQSPPPRPSLALPRQAHLRDSSFPTSAPTPSLSSSLSSSLRQSSSPWAFFQTVCPSLISAGSRTSLLIYQIVHLPNSPWDLFLIKGLGFSEWRMGLLGLVGTVMTALGAWFYRSCLMHVSWRKVLGVALVLMTGLDLVLLLTVFRINVKWGIPDLAFILGQNVLDAFLEGFRQLPLQILYLGFCPKGAEGTTLATLQTFNSLAIMTGNNLSLLALRIWPVDEPSVEQGHWGGIWKVSLLTALAQVLGLIGLPWLPRNVHHQRETQGKGQDRRNLWGGRALVAFVVLAFCWTVILDVVTIVQEF